MTETGKTARMTASRQKRGPLKTRLVGYFVVDVLLRHLYSVNMVVGINVAVVVPPGEEADGYTQQGAADGICLL